MFVQLSRNSGVPIRKQLYDAMTESILAGTLPPGEKLPSTRELSDSLGVARNTVVEIYEQLVSESYLAAYPGKGTFVEDRYGLMPQGSALQRPWGSASPAPAHPWRTTGEGVAAASEMVPVSLFADTQEAWPEGVVAFAGGVPDLGMFPRKAWLKVLRECLESADPALFGYGDVMGYSPLRMSLSAHLAKYKGIHCSPEQIVMVNGTADAILLCALMFRPEHRPLLVEASVIDFVPEVFRAMAYPLRPLPIDQEGILTDQLPEVTDGLLFCSPSHQFPLGGTLSIGRRLRLTDYARRNRHYLIEDDYSSEFRYAGAQVNSLAQLAPDRVIHLGTFSKTLAPFLRLGYMVVPEQLVPVVRQCQNMLSRRVNALDQMALAQLIDQGTYARHVLAAGKRYKRKMQCLVDALRKAFGSRAEIHGSHAGLHVAVTFPGLRFDAQTDKTLLQHGVFAERLSEYTLPEEPMERPPVGTGDAQPQCGASTTGGIQPHACHTLILGFGNLDEAAIREGVRRLKEALRGMWTSA